MNAFSNSRFHWPEYLMEAGELGLYMFSTCAIATLLQHPASPVRHVIANNFFRRAVMGLGMGSTVVAIVTSRWGKQSGAHFNPAVTLTFYRLGKTDFPHILPGSEYDEPTNMYASKIQLKILS